MVRIAREPLGLLGLGLVTLVLACAAFAPALAPYDPARINVVQKFQAISAAHWLGTDQLGRDTLSRVIWGARIAMYIAVLSIGSAAGAGIVLGMLAGSGPRWLDNLLVFLFDTVSSIPMILLALAVIMVVGHGTATLVLVIVAISTPIYARLIRAQTLALARADFIDAGRAIGAGLPRIMLVHLLPNVVGPLAIMISMDIPVVVSLEASLSFLGFGVRPPTPSWGSLLNDGYSQIREAPTLVLAAGLPLIVATLGFTFLGEALRDAFDPKLRRRKA